jgi:DNA-binding MarR family transcriptional regulator
MRAEWARERPDLDFSPLAVIYRLGRVRRLLEQRMAEVYTRHGLTAADFLVVVTLRRAGHPYRMPQARLMDVLSLTSGTVSLRLQRLTEAGVVIREPDLDDRRGSLIRLSDEGLRLFDAIAPEHLANEERLLSALGQDQRAVLADLLRHLLVSLEPARPSASSHLGMSVESAVTARTRRSAVGLTDAIGLLLSAVQPGSPADLAGLQRGDLITEADGVPLRSTPTLTDILATIGNHGSVDLTILRGNEVRHIAIRV